MLVELQILAADFRTLCRRFLDALERPLELEILMTLATDIDALGIRLDAVTAALPTDVATAVAAQLATDNAANAANIQALADANTSVTALAAKVAVLETAAGIQPAA
jgi:hypothetical protein